MNNLLQFHLYFQINRVDPSTGESWQPTRNSRVCSYHFVDGLPTARNPDPSLNLGKVFAIMFLKVPVALTANGKV